MDQRGRKSVEGHIAQVVHLPGKWPDPPENLTESQCENWRQIVRTRPYDWFGPETYPLLTEYVRSIDIASVLAQSMDGFTVNPDWMDDAAGVLRYERLTRLQKANAETLAKLATKMRLAQHSIQSEKVAASAAKNSANSRKPWARQEAS